MKITTCYSVALRSQMTSEAFNGAMKIDGSLLRATADECLAAYRMCLDIFRREWNGIRQVHSSTYRRRHCETLIHSTRGSAAAYPEFDEAHGYMPAYMRRSVISDALGAVSGFMSLHERWEEADPAERGSEPVLGCPDRYAMTFYKDSRETSLLNAGIIGLKLYDGRTWDWHYFRISASDARYIQRMGVGRKMLSPVIERKNHRWHVRFSFEEERQLTEKKPSEQRILAVDLGITAPATWCVMEPDGTVRARGSVRGRRLHRLRAPRQVREEARKACTAPPHVEKRRRSEESGPPGPQEGHEDQPRLRMEHLEARFRRLRGSEERQESRRGRSLRHMRVQHGKDIQLRPQRGLQYRSEVLPQGHREEVPCLLAPACQPEDDERPLEGGRGPLAWPQENPSAHKAATCRIKAGVSHGGRSSSVRRRCPRTCLSLVGLWPPPFQGA